MMTVTFRSLLIVLLFCVTSGSLYAQYYYVIIGGFAVEQNAIKFTGYARSLKYDAAYDLEKKRNLHYVYVLQTQVRNEALTFVKQLQADSEFKDAWVYSGMLARAVAPLADAPPAHDSIVVATVPEPEIISVEMPADSTSTTVPLKGKGFTFEIRDASGVVLPGFVHHVDFTRGRDVAVYKANQLSDVLPPSRFNNPMPLVCGIFGYKEVVKYVDFNSPQITEGAERLDDGTWKIVFPMERMKKGDASVMYHVSFYKDAVVMTASSKEEVDELVQMMKTNPGYRIKIHGHCNGNNQRKIISLGEKKNYFDIQGSNEINGSAKDLSRLRAEAIQSYLVENGIDKKRTDVYAWGGSNMLVPETSTSARLNDRIEIEITAD